MSYPSLASNPTPAWRLYPAKLARLPARSPMAACPRSEACWITAWASSDDEALDVLGVRHDVTEGEAVVGAETLGRGDRAGAADLRGAARRRVPPLDGPEGDGVDAARQIGAPRCQRKPTADNRCHAGRGRAG